MQIMVVDDEAALAKLLCDIIRVEGYPCEWTSNPVEAVQTIIQFRPQLVISDICMPDLSGVDLLRVVTKEVHDCYFVFHTANSEYSDKELIQMGALKVFKKPGQIDHMIQFLHGYFC